jgi:hypothetical protein
MRSRISPEGPKAVRTGTPVAAVKPAVISIMTSRSEPAP